METSSRSVVELHPLRGGVHSIMRMKMFLPVVAAVILLAGCSGTPPMVPVTGVVKRNGEPVEHCSVAFYPDRDDVNPLVHGYGICVTGPGGKYEMQNALGEKGIFPGKYKVTIVLYHMKDGKPMPMHMKPSEVPGGVTNAMPAELSDPRTSTEIVEVPRGGMTKDFDITVK